MKILMSRGLSENMSSNTSYPLQRPDDFDTQIHTSRLSIEYTNLLEISQGGPILGNIAVNGVSLEGRFGGPTWIDGSIVYIPKTEKSLFGTYFRLMKLDMDSMIRTEIGELHHMIWIEKVYDGKIYFYDSMDKSLSLSYHLR